MFYGAPMAHFARIAERHPQTAPDRRPLGVTGDIAKEGTIAEADRRNRRARQISERLGEAVVDAVLFVRSPTRSAT